MLPCAGGWTLGTASASRPLGSLPLSRPSGSRPKAGRSKFLFWSTLATLDIHPICAMDVEAIKFEWCCQMNMWLDRPAARQPNKTAQDAFRNLSWTLLSVKTVGMHLRCCSCKACQALTGAFLYNNDTKPPINWNITCLLSLASTAMLPKNVANDANLPV